MKDINEKQPKTSLDERVPDVYVIDFERCIVRRKRLQVLGLSAA